jgi:hypothetical protein
MRHSRTPTLRLVGGTASAFAAPAERPALTSPPSAEDIALVEAGRGLLAAATYRPGNGPRCGM